MTVCLEIVRVLFVGTVTQLSASLLAAGLIVLEDEIYLART